jgi:hypothetical protein
MSASNCQRPPSIDRRDRRLGNGQARSRRHRIKRAVGPVRPRSLRYMRIISTRLIPRVCGSIARSRRHSASSSAADLHGISLSRFSGFGISTSWRRCRYRASSSRNALIRSTTLARGSKRWRGDRMRRRLPTSTRPSVMPSAIFETGSKATITSVAPAVPRVFVFSMQVEQSIVVDPKSPGGINSPHGLILTSCARAAAALSANVIAAAIFASFRSSWPRDVRSLSSSASILIARVLLPSWRTARPM